MVSLVPVGVARPHCYVVCWDDYPSIQDKSPSWVNLLELLDILYLANMWATCLRYALNRVECVFLYECTHNRMVISKLFCSLTGITIAYYRVLSVSFAVFTDHLC